MKHFLHSKAVVRTLAIIGILLSIPFGFVIFIMGAFASDSGTTAAITTAFTLMGIALLYPILSLVSAIFGWRRNSLLLVVLPLILPTLLFAWMFGPFN